MSGRWDSVVGVVLVVATTVLTAGMASPARSAPGGPGGACQVGDTGRFTDCESGFYSWNIRQTNGGEITGTVDLAFTISEVVSPSSRQWSAHWTVYVLNLTGVAESGTTMAVVPECGGSCSAGTGLPDDGTVLSRNQSLAGDVSFSSPGTGRDTSTQTVNIYLFNPAAQTPGTTYGDPRTTLGPVRCDDGVSGVDAVEPPAPGCVLSEQVPTFVINSADYKAPPAPSHATFVANAQNDPRTLGFGRPGSGRPLVREYLPPGAIKDAKRNQGVCGPSFPRYSSPSGTADIDLDSCDEYPYLSSRQGVPLFAVAGHVPRGQNNAAGGRLSQFYSRYHVDDGDEFYVQP